MVKSELIKNVQNLYKPHSRRSVVIATIAKMEISASGFTIEIYYCIEMYYCI